MTLIIRLTLLLVLPALPILCALHTLFSVPAVSLGYMWSVYWTAWRYSWQISEW